MHEKHLNIATWKWRLPFILVEQAMFQMVAQCIFSSALFYMGTWLEKKQLVGRAAELRSIRCFQNSLNAGSSLEP